MRGDKVIQWVTRTARKADIPLFGASTNDLGLIETQVFGLTLLSVEARTISDILLSGCMSLSLISLATHHSDAQHEYAASMLPHRRRQAFTHTPNIRSSPRCNMVTAMYAGGLDLWEIALATFVMKASNESTLVT